jgi:hypothetical protein
MKPLKTLRLIADGHELFEQKGLTEETSRETEKAHALALGDGQLACPDIEEEAEK